MQFSIIDVNSDNVDKNGFFCVKNKKHPGYIAKRAWLTKRFEQGLRLKLLKGDDGKNYGFVEYTPGNSTFRIVEAPDYLVIHCIWVDSKKLDTSDNSRHLIQACLEDASENGFAGVAVVASDGTWMADRKVWLKHEFEITDEAEPHYQLLTKTTNGGGKAAFPSNWQERLDRIDKLELLYTPQCPYIGKAIAELPAVAEQHGTELKITSIDDPQEARRQMVSPYGMFNLVEKGRLLADHPISATRFRNILQKDLGLKNLKQ
jgi:hypothetical protein